MAKKNNCPTPVRREGGAAPSCKACSVAEDWCYRLADDPSGTVRKGKHTYDRDEDCARTNEKWIGDAGSEIDRCTVPLTELLCSVADSGGEGGGGVLPPSPITLEGQNCAGEATPATGLSGQIMQVVVKPGQAIPVYFCEGSTPGGGGTSSGLESDDDDVCVDGEFLRRHIVKKDGKPTGVVWYTDQSTGALVSPPPGAVLVPGKCETAPVQSVSSATANNLSGLLPGTSFSFLKTAACDVRVTTSVGSFIIPADATSYCTQTFKAPFAVTGLEVVDGTCDLSTITIISNSSF
jgi:hypothetical protein